MYHTKSPLLAWLIALASWSIGHVTPMTAALPSAAAGIATALIVYGLGRDLFGADAGRLAALVAMTTQGASWTSRWRRWMSAAISRSSRETGSPRRTLPSSAMPQP